MAIYLHGEELTNVFRLAGSDENSASYALGWTLDRSLHYRSLVLKEAFGDCIDASDAAITLQSHGEDGGYTDIEIRSGQAVHAILEDKLSWNLPTINQFYRYVNRLVTAGAKHQRLISVSAADQAHARRQLPPSLHGIGLSHLSWSDLRRLAREAEPLTSILHEKLWLRQLGQHLQEFASMERNRSNLVYMVVLSEKPMIEGQTHTWIDVVEKDHCYFHPVGNGSNRWPPQPQNYIGFRYWGRLQSVHHVDSYVIVNDLSTYNPLWVHTNSDHFVYRLGPPMRPAHELKSGNIWPNGRFECAIDTLLSGAFKTVRDAVDETNRRLKNGD
jgi:hypothetical protein